jgi:N-acetylglucosamine kinase-like BadF-type ATPase
MINKKVFELVDFIRSKDGIGNKAELINAVQKEFALTKDRSVYYSEHFAIRYSSSQSTSFSNTVLSLSNFIPNLL